MVLCSIATKIAQTARGDVAGDLGGARKWVAHAGPAVFIGPPEIVGGLVDVAEFENDRIPPIEPCILVLSRLVGRGGLVYRKRIRRTVDDLVVKDRIGTGEEPFIVGLGVVSDVVSVTFPVGGPDVHLHLVRVIDVLHRLPPE